MSGKMKAYVRTGATTQEVQLQDVPIPDYGADEVLIEVKALGVGIHDRYFIPSNVQFPYVIGSEGAETIAKKEVKWTTLILEILSFIPLVYKNEVAPGLPMP